VKDFLLNLFDIVKTTAKWSFSSFQFTDVLDILVVACIIYLLLVWVRKTKAWTLFKGIVVLLLIWGIASIFNLTMTVWIFERTLSVGILALVIIFQPELRRALEQIGRGKFIGNLKLFSSEEAISESTAKAVILAMRQMAEVKTGALIAFENRVPLNEYEQTGIPVDAKVSSQLLINIFEHNTPLHDGAVLIRKNRVLAATCYLPLSENGNISKELGTRHRAALGLSEVTDSKVFVVSEETGQMSMAFNGKLYRDIDEAFIRRELLGDGVERKKKKEVIQEKKNAIKGILSRKKDS
jgi:diadenylate cyclase